MPARDRTQWSQNEDGTWSRIHGKVMEKIEEVVEKAADAVVDLVSPSDDNGYEEMTKAELEEELESRGLPKYGNKPELIERLQENDSV